MAELNLKLGVLTIEGVKFTDPGVSFTETQTQGKKLFSVAENLTADYTDISSIENWDKWGPELYITGEHYGFKDWKALRGVIKKLVYTIIVDNFNNWDNLTAPQKIIACKYLPNKVPTANFVATIPDASERNKIALEFDSLSKEGRRKRFEIARMYTFNSLTVADCMDIVDFISEKLQSSYVGGIESNALDGKDGLFDYVSGTSGFAATGLPSKSYIPLNSPTVTLSDVCNGILDILQYGNY
jgi:hypothetical protein